ncbi:MAG: MFS transporter [Candidatus Nealsonbacteria bacterium]|nr:MFS transporter [Candidatus Nealsonbacteria bacterium]
MSEKINKVIKILILSDLILLTGLGFVAPIFAIFIANNIKGGDVRVAGFAASIYWIILSLVLIPFGRYLDKNHGEQDDLWFIIIGNFLAAFAVLGYIYSFLPWHIYALQGIYGVGMGMNIPGYTAIFTRHIDKGKEALSWSIRGAFVGMGTGVAGALGGTIAHYFGFKVLFLGVFVLLILSSVLLFLISKDISPKNKKMPKVPRTKTIEPPAPK